MELVINRDNLLAGLNAVTRSVSIRSTLPVLSHVQLRARGNTLELQASNLERCVYAKVAANVLEVGGICVPAKTLSDLINTMPDKPITLATNDKDVSLSVTCGGNSAKVKGVEADDFPMTALPIDSRVLSTKLAEFETVALVRALERTTFCTTVEQSRPTLTGVNFLIERGKAVLAATDGFRLAETTLDCQLTAENGVNVIVPSDSLKEVVRLAKGNSGNVALYHYGTNALIFDLGDVQVQTQLIDGRFPDYTPIIPVRHNARAIVSAAELQSACRLAGVFAKDTPAVKVELSPEDGITQGSVVLDGAGKEVGNGSATVFGDVTGKLKMAINIKFLADGLAAIGQGNAVLEAIDPTSPLVVKPEGDTSYIYVIMPMHFGS